MCARPTNAWRLKKQNSCRQMFRRGRPSAGFLASKNPRLRKIFSDWRDFTPACPPSTLLSPADVVTSELNSSIGRSYETQYDFGSRRAADDGLTSGIISSAQYAVPRHPDPGVVDQCLVTVSRKTRRCSPTIRDCATRRAIGCRKAAKPRRQRRIGILGRRRDGSGQERNAGRPYEKHETHCLAWLNGILTHWWRSSGRPAPSHTNRGSKFIL